MKSATKAIEDLAATVPVLAAAVDELQQRWGGEAPVTLLAATIGKRYVQAVSELTETSRIELFAGIDRAIDHGDSTVRDAVTTGVLEAMISEAIRQGVDRGVVDDYAGPLAGEYIRAWDDFTGG